MSLAIIVDAVFLLIAGLACGFGPRCRRKTVYVIALTCFAISLIVGAFPGMAALRHLKAMRREFPVVSLEDRLAYEPPMPTAATARLNRQVSAGLIEFERQLDVERWRRGQFETIHERQYELFVRANGFGVARINRPTQRDLRRPPLRDIAFSEAPADGSMRVGRAWEVLPEAGNGDQLAHLHAASRIDFLDPVWFGAVMEPRVRVAGFVEHGFHYPLKTSDAVPDAWEIERLELVSLLKFEEPRVYVLDHLPRMDQLSVDDIPTRPLDPFETGAISQLYAAEDLVIAQQETQHRMLGSLRAAGQCLDCHNASRGDLLGAFSYVLRPGIGNEE